jgi:hypothetical protein
MEVNMSKIIDTREVGRLLGLSCSGVRNRVASEKLHPLGRANRGYIFDLDNVLVVAHAQLRYDKAILEERTAELAERGALLAELGGDE